MIGTFILRCGEGTGMKNLEKHKFSTELFYNVVCKSSCIQLKKIQFRMCYLIGQPNFIFDGSCLWWIVMVFFSVLHWLLKMSPLSIHQLCHNWKVQLPNKKGFVSFYMISNFLLSNFNTIYTKTRKSLDCFASPWNSAKSYNLTRKNAVFQAPESLLCLGSY